MTSKKIFPVQVQGYTWRNDVWSVCGAQLAHLHHAPRRQEEDCGGIVVKKGLRTLTEVYIPVTLSDVLPATVYYTYIPA